MWMCPLTLDGQTPYVLMLDDEILLPEESLKRMADFLDEHSDFGAIGLCKHRSLNFASDEGFLNAFHVDMSCVLFRKGVLEAITFADTHNAQKLGRERLAGGCECANACHDDGLSGHDGGAAKNPCRTQLIRGWEV